MGRWSKFFWNDWRGDPALRMCSLAAQGLWMQMLCVAAESDPVGYVTIAGHAVDEAGLARLVGETVDVVKTLLAELRHRGVFSVTKGGVIYNRRMVRTEKKARIARENGKMGGNPSLCKTTVSDASDNPPLVEERTPEARSQKLEVGSEDSNESSAARAATQVVIPFTPPDDPKRELYRFGIEVLGNKSGGMVTNLLSACRGDIADARYTLSKAQQSANSREYIGAVLRGARTTDHDYVAEYRSYGLPLDQMGL